MPSRSSACNAFFPVGLIRSPIILVGPPNVIGTAVYSVASMDGRMYVAGHCHPKYGSFSFASFATAAICTGSEPQQPPTIPAPASMSFPICDANSSGVMSYTVAPPTSFGIPAFGFAMIGISATDAISSTIATIVSGPAEQFTPTASAPSDCKTTIAAFGVVPYIVLLSPAKVIVTITGKSQVSLTASTAARHSCRLIMVSTTNKSTPAATRTRTCSL